MRLPTLAAVAATLALSCVGAATAASAPLPASQEGGLPGSTVRVPADRPVPDLAAGHGAGSVETRTPAAPRPRRKLEPVATYSGLGFDTCAAPPVDVMQTWATSSPYHAAGIYIGGSDRACPDGNLSPSWVRQVSAQGWKLFPIYVGRQAPCWKDPGDGHPARIERGRRWTQGEEAADDAADRAAYFGIAQGSPIYIDMEYYPRADRACGEDVQAFLSAWTDQLHARGFISGIYSSAYGAIAEMSQVYDTGAAYRADVAWFAHWDKKPQLFGDPTLSDRLWPGHRRIKQFAGGHNETYGGKRLNIDLNVLDAPVAALE